jgi:hypothetical protein
MAVTTSEAFLGGQVLHVTWQEPRNLSPSSITLEDSRIIEWSLSSIKLCNPTMGEFMRWYSTMISKVGRRRKRSPVCCFRQSSKMSSSDPPTLGKVGLAFWIQRASCTILPRRPARNDRDRSRDCKRKAQTVTKAGYR